MLARSRRVRSIEYNQTNSEHDRVKRSPIQFPDTLSSLNQKAVDEPVVDCDDRRQLGTQILKEKGEYADSMLSRFVGNIVVMFSNQTTAQEVSLMRHNVTVASFVLCYRLLFCFYFVCRRM